MGEVLGFASIAVIEIRKGRIGTIVRNMRIRTVGITAVSGRIPIKAVGKMLADAKAQVLLSSRRGPETDDVLSRSTCYSIPTRLLF